MLRLTRSRLTGAHAIALLALFISLGGTSYAVTKLPRNSVGSAQVKDGSLKATDLADGVLSSSTARASAPRGPRGPEGPAGAVGPTGGIGPAGPTGPAGQSSMRFADLGNATVSLSRSAWGQTKVLRIPNVPAGTYRADAVVELAFEGGPVIAWCETATLGVDQANESAAVRTSIMGTTIGVGAEASKVQSLADFGVVKRSTPFTIWVSCWTNTDIASGPAPTAGHAKLAITRFDDVATISQ